MAAKLVADGWCAAFVQPKAGATTSGQGITHATVRALSETPESVPDTIVTQVNALARQYRFFHWHLEFPGIFTVPDDGSADTGTGWTGGFSCVVGNPLRKLSVCCGSFCCCGTTRGNGRLATVLRDAA